MPLFVGVDISKSFHVVALLSADLLARHRTYERCPLLKIENNRAGLEHLLRTLLTYAPAADCHVLTERTGHYGAALEQFLQEQGCPLYHIQSQKRYGRTKTDEQDARALCVLLYTQVGLAAPMIDETRRIYPVLPPSETAIKLRGLIQHRYELQREAVRRKNKLTAIADELFPELTQIFKDPNSPTALNLRTKFPTAAAIATATLDELREIRQRQLPAPEQLARLPELARATIGTRNAARLHSLQIEQRMLIAELRLLHTHTEELDATISSIVASSREGQILTSLVGVGALQAATLIAGIGTIANFASASKLRGYLGWRPRQTQTGISLDSSALEKSGNALLKRTVFLSVVNATRYDASWKLLYERLVKRKCVYDERTKRYKGKLKVIGRVAGQMIGVIYTLLKHDHDVLHSLSPGEEPPAPVLYSVDTHLDRLRH